LEKLARLGITGSELERAFKLGTGEIGFLFVQIEAREVGVRRGGLAQTKRVAKLGNGVIATALAALHLGEPLVRDRVVGILCHGRVKLLLGIGKISRGEQLPAAPGVGQGGVRG